MKRPLIPRNTRVGRDIVVWYNELFDPLQAHLFSHVQSVKDAEDMAQEAFLHLWFARSSGPIANPKRFLFATAANLLRDHRRRARSHARRTDVSVEDVEKPEPVGRD